MINLLTTLGGAGAPTGAATDKPAEGETPFAGLLALLGGGNAASADDAGDTPDAIAGLLGKAEAALADPDLSEDEIAAIVGPVIAQIGAALAADPGLLEKARALVADLSETLGAEEAMPDLSWRDLSQGLAKLQALLGGAEEVEGDGTELAALLQQVIDVAEKIAQPFMPVVSGLGQLLSLPLRDAPDAVEAIEAGNVEAEQDLAELPRDLRANVADVAEDAEVEPDLSGGSEGDAPEAPVNAARSEFRPAASFTLAAPSAVQSGDQPAQVGTLQAQATPLAPVSATPLAASAFAASQMVSTAPQVAVQGQDILGQIRARASDDGQIKVELKPEGLGKVEISLGPDEAGKMQVVVRADQAAVLSALRAERDGLVAMLRDAGHAVEDGALSFGDLGAQGGAQDGGQGQDSGRTGGGFMTYGAAGSEASSLADAAGMQSIRLPEGSVDIRI